jgi:hypothetical protein
MTADGVNKTPALTYPFNTSCLATSPAKQQLLKHIHIKDCPSLPPPESR